MVSLAVDVAGPDAARPYVEKAKVTYPVWIDRALAVPSAVGETVIPLVLVFDRDGTLLLVTRGGPTKRVVEAVRAALASAKAPAGAAPPSRTAEPGSAAKARVETPVQKLMRRADGELRKGARKEALATLREAWALEPMNWLVRKQIWAIESPERFYEGGVDFRWQTEQIAREDAERAKAKPVPPKSETASRPAGG